MNMRAWFIVVGIVAMVALNGFLISTEHIQDLDIKKEVSVKRDLLDGLIYTSSYREQNLKDFGMNDSQVKRASKLFAKLEKKRTQLKARLLDSDQTLLTGVFCSNRQKNDAPPRYGAMRLLIEQEKGKRIVIDWQSRLDFELQAWSQSIDFERVYEETALVNPAKPDELLEAATVMSVYAILLKQESMLVAKDPPWGSALDGSWSLSKMEKEYLNPAVETEMINYLTLMHFLTELATEEGGLC